MLNIACIQYIILYLLMIRTQAPVGLWQKKDELTYPGYIQYMYSTSLKNPKFFFTLTCIFAGQGSEGVTV